MDSRGLDNRAPAARLMELSNTAVDWWFGELRDLSRQLSPFGQTRPLRLALGTSDELVPVEQEKNIGAGRRDVALHLNDSLFLYRKIMLPRAAGRNIERVIGYEFGKYFPMSAEDALFSCRILPSDADAGSIGVEIWAINRQQVDVYLALIRRNFGIEVLRLLIGDADGNTRITYDIEQERRRRAAGKNILYGRMLNLLLVALAAALFAYPLIRMDSYLDQQRKEIERLEARAKPVIETRQKIMALDERFQQLIAKKKEFPAKADVWSYLTRVVGDQAVLERMTIGGDKVHLAGRTKSVERLLRGLESEQRIASVKIVGQVRPTLDNRFEVLDLRLELRE